MESEKTTCVVSEYPRTARVAIKKSLIIGPEYSWRVIGKDNTALRYWNDIHMW